MHFALDENTQLFQESAEKFFRSSGQEGLIRRYVGGEKKVLDDLWRDMGNLGYFAITISEEYGGLGQGAMSLIPILEELGRGLVPGLYPETVALAVPLLEKYGTVEQKEHYLPRIVEGKERFTLAFLERDLNYNPEEIQMESVKSDDQYIIDGVKALVPHADIATAFIIPIRTGKGESENGISLLIVDKKDSNIRLKELESIDRTRKLFNITFSKVRVPRSQILGHENMGWGILQDALVYLNFAYISTMVGSMGKIVDMSVEQGTTRIQFGQPIGRFQAIKHRIVDMKSELESARSLSYYSGWALESGEVDKNSAVFSARAYATDAFIRLAEQNIQIHGGMGFALESGCHLYIKRARSLESYLGSPEDFRNKTAVELGWK